MKRIVLMGCAVWILSLIGCSDDNGNTGDPDKGPGGDLAMLEAGTDAPKPDGQPPQPDGQPPVPDGQPPVPDGQPPQPDGQPPVPDGQPPQPDGPAPDGPIPDTAAPAPDMGPQPDAGLSQCSAFFGNCSSINFVDARSSLQLREVSWSLGSFKPKCIHIKLNQTIKFTGVTLHKITQVCGPAENFNTGFGNTRNWKFTKIGTYGYEWPPGGTNLFRGAVKVTAF